VGGLIQELIQTTNDMPIKNYTTSIAEEKTVAEIQMLLAVKGAKTIQIEYDEKARPTAVSFIIVIQGIPIPFQLPCNFEGVYKAMVKEYAQWQARNRFERNPESKNQARRIAWRIVKDWVAAQMALVEAEQATLAQVFLPYAMVNGNSRLTMYDRFLEQVSSQKALPESVA